MSTIYNYRISVNPVSLKSKKPMDSVRKTKIIIWDFDGTLGYRQGKWSGTLSEIIKKRHPELLIKLPEVRAKFGKGFPWHFPEKPHTHINTSQGWWDALDPFFTGIFMRLGFSKIESQIMASQVRKKYPQPHLWRLYPDSLAIIRYLSNLGWGHVLLSNHVPELPMILRHLRLSPFMQAVFNSAEFGYEKPHPEAFNIVLRRFSESTCFCMVGDNLQADFLGAQKVGIPCILVRQKENLDHPSACTNLRCLPNLLNATQTDCQEK